MSTLACYHRRDRDMVVDLADLPASLYNEIASLRGQIERSSAPVLTCLGNGEPMFVRRNSYGRYFACHFPGGAHRDGSTHYMVAMSDEHRRQAEYVQRAAADHGFDASLERSTGNKTRLDVAVVGDCNAGYEIQRSHLTRAQAKRRAKNSYDAGWPTAWISDSERRPDWAGHVPTARMPTATLFSDSVPPRGAARVIIGSFTRERDKQRSTGWAYRREAHTIPLDDLAYRMPAGEIVPVAVGAKGRVDLAFADAREVIDSATYPGASAWNPTDATPQSKVAVENITRECAAHDDVPSDRCPLCLGLLAVGVHDHPFARPLTRSGMGGAS